MFRKKMIEQICSWIDNCNKKLTVSEVEARFQVTFSEYELVAITAHLVRSK